jgi:hypothetical protein
MLDILWGCVAVSVLALSGATVALLLALRENVKKGGQSLDALNRELPAILAAARRSAEDAENVLSMGGKVARGLGWLTSLLKGAQTVTGLFKGHQAPEA